MSYNILFSQSLFQKMQYMAMYIMLTWKKNGKTKYLNFIIQTEGDIHNCQFFNQKMGHP